MKPCAQVVPGRGWQEAALSSLSQKLVLGKAAAARAAAVAWARALPAIRPISHPPVGLGCLLSIAPRKAPRQLAGPPRPAGCLSFLESRRAFGLTHWAKLQAYAAWLSAIPGSCAAGGSCASWQKVPAPASCRATVRPLLSLQRPLSPAGMLRCGPWHL